jgi:hypothetical protein
MGRAPRTSSSTQAWRWSALLALAGATAARAEPPAPPAADETPAVRVAVTPVRGSLRLGIDKETEVAIDLSGAHAEAFRPLRALATVGTVEPLRSRGAGHFVTRFVAPDSRVPQTALLVFELGDGTQRIHGSARIPMEGSTVFPFHTNAGASVTMRVAGRQFGPAIADKQGHVEIPISVPPGMDKGQARAVDRGGESRDTEVDLHLPPYPRVLVLAPAEAEAGSLSEITVLAVDDRGGSQVPGQLSLIASIGLCHPLGGEPGEARFLFEAPPHIDGTVGVALTASAAGAVPARADATLALRAAAPQQVDIDTATDRLIVGERRSVPITISARDRYGNPTPVDSATVRVDGHPQPLQAAPSGMAVFWLPSPARYDGHERVEIAVEMGRLRATKSLRVTGGAPAALTIRVAPGPIVADGKRGTELQVQAIDRNGTPTSVPGLSWETPEGRIRGVRVPRDGEYLAEYVPERTREAHTELVAVMASESVRAETFVKVAPPPIRLVAAVHAGFYTTFGPSVGPAVFLEGLAPIRLGHVRLFAGLSSGYLGSDVTGRGVQGTGTAHVETNQVPLLAVGRAGLSWPSGFELAAQLDAGWSWAWVRLTTSPSGMAVTDLGTANAPAVGGGMLLTYPLRPGRLAVGLRYLWIELGQTSQGDQLSGNSAGMVADLGYEMTF